MVSVAIRQPEATTERLLYGWKAQSGMGGIKAATAAALLTDLEAHEGAVTAAAVVKLARQPDSPLHRAFEWNDKAAAQRYRLLQGANVIRALVVVRRVGKEAPSEPVRCFVRLRTTGEDDDLDETLIGTGRYVSFVRVLKQPDAYQRLLDQARGDLEVWRNKYRDLEAFSPVVEAIDAALAG